MNFVRSISFETWIKWAVGLILFMISSTYYIVNMQNSSFHRIDKLEEHVGSLIEKANKLEDKQNDFNVVMAKIEQNLTNMSSDLLLIKKKLDEMQE